MMKAILFLLTFIFSFIVNIVNAQAQDYKWAVNGIGTGDDRGFKIITDNSGNIIATGRFHSKEIQFGDFKIMNSAQESGTSDIFIAKYNPNRNIIWAKSLGGKETNLGAILKLTAKAILF